MANANYRTIPAHLSERTAFAGNSMRGDWFTADTAPHEGRLSGFDAAAYREVIEWAARSDLPLYVVRSYATPIAWRLGPDGPGYVVEEKFSPTTSRQQNLCSAYLMDDFDRAAASVISA